MCWLMPLCHQSQSTSVAQRYSAYEHDIGCSHLSCSSLTAMDDLRISFCFRSTFLPPFAPRSLRASQLVWRLSHPSAFHLRSCGDPPFTSPESVLSFCVQPPHAFPSPLSTRSFLFAFRVRLWRAVSLPRPSDFKASPFGSRLAKTPGRIDFLSCGPTDSPSVALHPALRRRSYGRLSTSRAFG